MKIAYTLLVSLVILIGCSAAISEAAGQNNDAESVVYQLFVRRLSNPETYNYFNFWGLDAAQPFLDDQLQKGYTKFKSECERLFPPWGKWSPGSEFKLGSFPIYARNDPLTMCAQKPISIKTNKVAETETGASYKVKYVEQGSALKYYSICNILLNKINGKWLVASVETEVHDVTGVKTYSFLSRLEFLTKQLRLAKRNS